MKIFIIGDTHFPFHHRPTLSRILSDIKKIRPSVVVQIGDLYDQYSFSRYTKKNFITSKREIKQARRYAEIMWARIRKTVPDARCIQMYGNHDLRLTKRVADKIPEATEFIQEHINKLYTFEGVETIYDYKQAVKIGGVSFIHGHLSRLGDHSKSLGGSVVCGHSHVGGCVFRRQSRRTLFELNAGALIDKNCEAAGYGEIKRDKWTYGYGLIDELGPRFIPIGA